jgi:mutator protein MutT
VRVGIGLVNRQGYFLVRRRPPGKALAGFWEFPGGKCQPGEEPAEAASRECSEELGMSVVVDGLRGQVLHDYPHASVELSFFDCHLEDPSRQPGPATDFQWVAGEELAALDFPEANAAIIQALARDAVSSREG